MDRFAKVFALTLAALLGLCLGMLAPVPEVPLPDEPPPDLATPDLARLRVCEVNRATGMDADVIRH